MQNDKLLPCPFCGGEAIKVAFTWVNIADESTIDCTICGARTKVLKTEEAIKSWNTRKPMERIVEQLEKNGQKMSEAKAIRPYGKHSPADHRYYKAISVKKAVDIVRNGGKE